MHAAYLFTLIYPTFLFYSLHSINDRNRTANEWWVYILTESSLCVVLYEWKERIQYITVGADSNFLSWIRKCDLDI